MRAGKSECARRAANTLSVPPTLRAPDPLRGLLQTISSASVGHLSPKQKHECRTCDPELTTVHSVMLRSSDLQP